MNTAIELIAFIAAGGVLAPSLLLLLQVLAARLPRRAPRVDNVARPRVAVLVPAHNEAEGIAATLAALRMQLLLGDQLLVVADNCSDDTAQVARIYGAKVFERHDPVRRGKGYALDCGLQLLDIDPPEVVIVVDADCEVMPGAIGHLARRCISTGRPVQALYLMEPSTNGGRLAPLVEFAWIVRNWVRPLGCLQLGLPCQLMGTGMAIPWSLLNGISLADGHIVEDMKLGVNLARAGAAPLFCPEVQVRSRFPTSTSGQQQQRRRWEHGHLAMICREMPRALLSGLRRRNPALLALALDMSIPPLALLALSALCAVVLGGIALGIAHEALPLWLGLGACSALCLAIVSAWSGHGRAIVSARQLLLAPFYAIAKLPLYLGFALRRQVEWVRSDRSRPDQPLP